MEKIKNWNSVFVWALLLLVGTIPSCNENLDPVSAHNSNDTLIVRDTTYSIDSLFRIDSMFSKDTVTILDSTFTYDTVYSMDTIVSIDTSFLYDSLIIFDSIFTIDTVFSFDTVYSYDTIRSYDTTHTYDTIYSYDTMYHYDTVTIFDTLFVTSSTWEKIVDSVADASYMIALRLGGSGELILIGSGSAIDNRTIISNAHVYTALLSQFILYKQLEYSVTPVAVQNGWGGRSTHAFKIDIGGFHEDYDKNTVFSPDIGFFKTESDLPNYIHLPENDTIRMLKVGQQVATLGFPGETSERIRHIATATFKDGVISSLTPFDPDATPNPFNTLMVQHNFNTTSGTSGSPIIDVEGRLVAVHNSGIYKLIWNDATGDFTEVLQGAIGFGIRADVVNDMFKNGTLKRDTISTWPIPSLYRYWPGSRIALKNGIKPVYVGTTVSAAKSAANTLFGKNSPDVTTSEGHLWYSDDMSYRVLLLKSSGRDNIWAISIKDANSSIYLPSFRDFWDITIGTSRTYILNTHGYNYTTDFSTDSSHYYYNYSDLGVGFGFDIAEEDDWNCDAIQIAEPGTLAKRTAGQVKGSKFPNLGRFDTPTKSAGPKRIKLNVERKFR